MPNQGTRQRRRRGKEFDIDGYFKDHNDQYDYDYWRRVKPEIDPFMQPDSAETLESKAAYLTALAANETEEREADEQTTGLPGFSESEYLEAIYYNKKYLHHDLYRAIASFLGLTEVDIQAIVMRKAFVQRVALFQQEEVVNPYLVYTKGRDPDIDGKVGDKTLAALEKAGLDVHKIHAAAFQQELKEEVLRNLTKNKKRVQEALTRYKKEGALHSNAFTRLKEMVHYDEKLGEKQLFLRQQYNTLYARNLDEKSVTAPRITPELMQQVHAITEAHKTVVESRIYLRMLYPELNIVYPDPEHKVLYPPNPEESRYYFNLYEIASKTDAEIYAKLDQGFNDITAAIENVREEVTNDSFPLEKLDPAIDRVLSRHEKNTRFIQDARTWQAEELEKEQEYNFKGTVLTIGLSVAGILAAPFSGGASLLLLLGGSLSGLATSAYNFERANDLYNAGVSSTYADAHLIENLELLRYNRTIAYVNLVFSIVDTFLAAKGFSKALQMRKTAKANISAAMKVKIVDEVVKVNIPQGLSKNQFKIASNLIRQKAGFISDDILVHGSRANYTSSITSDIDFAIRVSPEKFDRMIKQCFKNPNIGSAKEKTMLHAIKTGKIQAGEAGLRSLRKELKRTLGMNVDISIIKKGGPFDKGPYMKLTD